MAFPIVDGLRTIEFGTPGDSRARIVNFVVNGNKRATAGLLSEYATETEPVEIVGECLAMTDNDGRHVATLRVTRVEVTRFADVPDEFALAEAEGDLSAADFRTSHHLYWKNAGEIVTDDTEIVQIYFELLTHKLRRLQPTDAEWIYRACQDSEIQRFTLVPRPYTMVHAESFVIDNAGERIAYAICDTNDDSPVGVVGIHQIKNGIATVGYWVAPWGRRRGAATVALHILPSLAQRLELVHEIHAVIAESNGASRGAAQRAGFQFVGMAPESCPDGDGKVAGMMYSKIV